MSSESGDIPRGEGGTGIGGGGAEVIGASKHGKSWAEMLGSSLPSSLNKNILEVVLEKDERGAFFVSEEDCARLLRKLGLDPRPGVQVEGVQICPTGRGVILITLKDGVKAESFCRYDVFVVTENGIRSIMVKPAGKKEVVVTLKGIHPNTRDRMVLDYLSKFGKIVSTKAVHGIFSAGPLKGMRNGNRSYKVEIKPGENIGSYHVIECQKVSLRYPGQQQTCGRCHQTPLKCIGKGIAKRCQAEGGVRVEFTDYILGLWKRIGYSPQNLELDNVSNDDEADELVGESFTPDARVPVNEIFAGVSIKHFPKDTDQGEVTEFLCTNGLPADKTDDILFKPNGTVIVKNLDNKSSQSLIAAIHGKENFGKKLFCNGIIPLTPIKDTIAEAKDSAAKSPGSGSESPPSISKSPGKTPLLLFNGQIPDTADHDDTSNLVRRHSLSLLNRTPPKISLAAELLARTPRPDLNRTKALVSDLKDCLSDFGSCVSEMSDDDYGEDADDNREISDDSMAQVVAGYQTLNEKRRIKRNKRKMKLTPGKDEFLKKPNLVLSPTET